MTKQTIAYFVVILDFSPKKILLPAFGIPTEGGGAVGQIPDAVGVDERLRCRYTNLRTERPTVRDRSQDLSSQTVQPIKLSILPRSVNEGTGGILRAQALVLQDHINFYHNSLTRGEKA